MNAGPCERVDKGSQSSSLSGEQDHDLFMRQLHRRVIANGRQFPRK